MKYLKKFLCLMLSMLFIITTFSGCSTLNPDNIESNITKGEWIDLLSSHFGLQNDKKHDPYFKDISKENELYDYVQACVDWDIIPKSDNFESKSKVTKEYAFATAVRAIGKEVTGLDNDASNREASKKAVEMGLADNASWVYMHEGIDKNEAEKISKNAAIKFCGHEIVDHDNSEYKDNVKIQDNTDGLIIDSTDNTISVDNQNPNAPKEKYNQGDIVVLGSGKDLKQLKIVGVSEQEGKVIYDTEIPTIDEVYDEIDAGGTGILEDASDIHCEEGVTLSAVDGVALANSLKEATVESLGLADSNLETEDTAHKGITDFTIDLSFGSTSKPKVTFSAGTQNGKNFSAEYNNEKKANHDDYDIKKTVDGKAVDTSGVEIDNDTMYKYEEAKITEYKNGNTKTVKTGKEYKKGYNIKGSLTVSNLNPQANVKTKKTLGVITGFESYEFTFNPTFSGKITFDGYASFERTLAAIEFAVGPLVLEASLKMAVEFNGDIIFKVDVKQNTDISYTKKNGFKKVCTAEMDKSMSFEATLKLTPVKISVAIKLGWFNLIDASVSASVKFSLSLSGTYFVYSKEGIFKKGGDEAKLEDAQEGFLFCREYKLVLPVIEVEIGSSESLLGKFGVTFTWTIWDEEKAPLKSYVVEAHCEGKALNKVKQCTLETLKPYEYKNIEEAKEDENYGDSETGNETNSLQIDTYTLNVTAGKTAKINVTQLPKGYSMGEINVESSDNNVASVSKLDIDGAITIKGKAEGNATITISVGDGNQTLSVLVMVTDE